MKISLALCGWDIGRYNQSGDVEPVGIGGGHCPMPSYVRDLPICRFGHLQVF